MPERKPTEAPIPMNRNRFADISAIGK